ncbi:hypothetical protein V7S43_016955 [Phytophthora oleae]|uniref:Uncharacterized protein n=1 Tax=Phytophthora oleae TaxID=2107226 RepID=A0ABD3EUE7_9STRA
MATSVENALLLRQRAIATETEASEQVLDDRRRVLRLREHYPDTNSVMCEAMRKLVASEEAFAEARRVAEQADRNCEQAFTDDRARWLASHR